MAGFWNPTRRPPSFEATMDDAWQELVTSAIRRHLPQTIRRRRIARDLDQWRRAAVPCPFGRARSALQDGLREMLTAATRELDGLRDDHVSVS